MPHVQSAGPPQCPACGHDLSMFAEPPDPAPDRFASVIADVMGSWYFLLVLVLGTAAFSAVCLATGLLGTERAVLFNDLGIALTVLVAFQTPLILLTQRRDAARDRERDREALRVSTHAETDLHAIRDALGALEARIAPRLPAPSRPNAEAEAKPGTDHDVD